MIRNSNIAADAGIDPGKITGPHVGHTFYVWSTHANAADNSRGGSKTNPFKTLNFAIGRCTANNGDRIYVLPGHAESLAAAGSIFTANVAGIEIVGLGVGNLRPTFTLAHASAQASVSAANVRLSGVKFISDIADCAAAIVLAATADGFVCEDCWFTDGGLTKELVIGIMVGAATDNVLIRGNRFYTTSTDETGGCASAIKLLGESAFSRIIGNTAHGHYTVAAIDGATALATKLIVTDNVLYNIDTDAGLTLKLHASTTGLVARNLVCGGKATVRPINAAGCFCAENYGMDAAGASAVIDPAVGAF